MSNINNNKGKLLISFLIVFLSSIFLTYSIDIDNCKQLQNISNDLSESYQLTKDINCINETNFKPIGNFSNSFNGYLEGNDYTISNLSINNNNSNYTGLFGYIEKDNNNDNTKDYKKSKYNIAIKDLKIDNISVVGGNYTGSIAGAIKGASIMDIEIFNGKVNGSNVYTGGLFGLIEPVEGVDNFRYDINIEDISGDVDVTISKTINNDLDNLRTDLNFNFEIIEECDEKTLFYIKDNDFCLNQEYLNYEIIADFIGYDHKELGKSFDSINSKYYEKGEIERKNVIDKDYGNGIFGSINGKFVDVKNNKIKIEYYTKGIINRNDIFTILNIKTCENFADLLGVSQYYYSSDRAYSYYYSSDRIYAISLANDIDCEGEVFEQGFNNVEYFFGNGNTISNFVIKSNKSSTAFINNDYTYIDKFEEGINETDTLENGTNITYFGTYFIGGIIDDLTLDNVNIYGPDEVSFFGHYLNIKLDDVDVINSKVYSNTTNGSQLYQYLPLEYVDWYNVYKLKDEKNDIKSCGDGIEVYHNGSSLFIEGKKCSSGSSSSSGGSSGGGSFGGSTPTIVNDTPEVEEPIPEIIVEEEIEIPDKEEETPPTTQPMDDNDNEKEDGKSFPWVWIIVVVVIILIEVCIYYRKQLKKLLFPK